MARLPRLYAPGLTQLVIADLVKDPLSGKNLQLTPDLLRDLLQWIGDAAKTYQVSVHGWVITPNSIAMLATPSSAQGISRLMQTLGRNLAARLKSGSVFSGRYHSTLLESGAWVLPALTWLEWIPVREGLTTDPEQWTWSSAHAHTGQAGVLASWLEQHVDYWGLGNTPFDRQARYRTLLQDGNSSAVNQKIASSLRGQWALGSETFLSSISESASRRIQPGVRGRPKKRTESVN